MAVHPEISVEFFPPKNEPGRERLLAAMAALAPLEPAYASVTYGAGGSTQERTLATVQLVKSESRFEPVPHLTCIGSTEAGIQELLDRYRGWGIQRIVALRGDLPEGMENPGFFRHASDLVAYIRDHGNFEILVSAYPEVHPEAASATADLDYLVAKVQAGASGLVTQYFYNPDAYLHLRDALVRRGVDVPVTVGVMPMVSYEQTARFSAQCGAEIPRFLRLAMEACADDLAAQWQTGVEILSRQCQLLLREGVPGFHFYTLNQAETTLAIWRNLSI